jgi:hypothetical protein
MELFMNKLTKQIVSDQELPPQNYKCHGILVVSRIGITLGTSWMLMFQSNRSISCISIWIYLGEVLGDVYLVEGLNMRPSLQWKPISIFANSTTSTDGQMVVDKSANSVKVLVDCNSEEYYNRVADSLRNKEQYAIISSFAE